MPIQLRVQHLDGRHSGPFPMRYPGRVRFAKKNDAHWTTKMAMHSNEGLSTY